MKSKPLFIFLRLGILVVPVLLGRDCSMIGSLWRKPTLIGFATTTDFNGKKLDRSGHSFLSYRPPAQGGEPCNLIG